MQKNAFYSNLGVAIILFILPLLPYFHLLVEVEALYYSKSTEDFIYKNELVYHLSYWGYYMVSLAVWSQFSTKERNIGIYFILLWASYMFLGHATDITSHFGQNVKIIFFLAYLFCQPFRFGGFSKFSRIWSSLQKIETYLIVFLFALPLLANICWFLPEERPINLLIFEVGNFGFYDANRFIYHFLNKLVFLLAILVWFFTERRWFKYALLSPILMLFAQLHSMFFNIDSEVLDELELAESWPLLTGISVFLVFVAKAAENQERINIAMEGYYQKMGLQVKRSLEKRQLRIEEKKEAIKSKNLNSDELERLKEELLKELKNVV